MPSTHTLVLVAAAASVLWMLPGPALLLLLTRGIDLGSRGAVATALGLSAGTTLHVAAAALGLSVVVAASASAFSVVKVLGAGYLIWLGIQRIRDPSPLVPVADEDDGRPPRTGRRAFVEGVTINALNPKVAVFFLAFLPPFVDRAAGPVWAQTLVLGLLVAAVLLIGDVLFALLTGSLGRRWVRRLSRRGSTQRLGRYAVGSVYVGLGLLTLAAGDRGPAASRT